MAWDPRQYLVFSNERTRPGLDLLAQIGDLPAGPIFDLGCGTGNHARIIADRWPEHRVTGIDSSPEMLRQAAVERSRVEWRHADIAAWSAPEKAALIFSNAALHWLDSHEILLPRLFRQLAPGGTLAIQMPRNFDAPAHRLMRRVATEGSWADRLVPLLRPDPVRAPQFYYDLMAKECAGVTLWETEYLHVFSAEADGCSPVLDWLSGTALHPLLAPLSGVEQESFKHALDNALKEAYPRRRDGKTLFPFRRLFLLALS